MDVRLSAAEQAEIWDRYEAGQLKGTKTSFAPLGPGQSPNTRVGSERQVFHFPSIGH
jgi:hypothetical protein